MTALPTTSEVSNPAASRSVTQVGIAVVEWQQKYLVGVRAVGTVLAGAAEFPGGKCLPDESPLECAVRECREETGLVVQAAGLLVQSVHAYPHGVVELTFVRCIPTEPQVSPQGSFRWVPRAKLRQLDFPAANQAVIDTLCPH